jgi:transcriptional pleiotropic regulator of transition state genes
MITGEVSSDNKVYPGNIVLSDKGAEILKKELEDNLQES